MRDLLADAVAESILAKLRSGAGFVRVPEAFSPMPISRILSQLTQYVGVRVGVFVDDWPEQSVAGLTVTTDVATVIDWRNDAKVSDSIVIIGNLERDRAAGLADIGCVPLEFIKKQLFAGAIKELKDNTISQPAQRLVRTLSEWKSLTDLRSCADYCQAIVPADATTVMRVRSQLWRVSLLPDDYDQDIDGKRLHANLQLVDQLRRMDASTRQRLIRYAGSSEDGSVRQDYTPLRLFASTGDSAHLSTLTFSAVQGAVKASATKLRKKDDNDAADAAHLTLAAFASGQFDEQGFLSQVIDASSEDSPISVGETRIADWSYDSLEAIELLLADTTDTFGYASQSGSIEQLPDDALFPEPGSGKVEWRNLVSISIKLRKLETERAGRADCVCADSVDRIVELREQLDQYRRSIVTEGTRLFMASPTVRAIALELVKSWVTLWTDLEQLRVSLVPGDRVHVRRLAELLVTCDLRVTIHRGDVNAYVMPLHPLVLEPRIRAAELFLSGGADATPMFDLIVGSLDPAVPSISVLRDGSPVSLGYAGQYKGALHYAKKPRQVDSTDVLQTLKQLIQRFMNVHPYSKLSLAVGMVNPPPKTAKALLRWLAAGVGERVSLTAFTTSSDEDDLRVALDEAREELINSEIAARSFDFDVLALRDVTELPAHLNESELVPHLLFMFDMADIEQSSQGANFATPPLGSLISEWDFDTDPLEDSRPIIRPRSGSGLLTTFLEAQAGLFEMSLPTQQRSPLLSLEVSAALAKLAELSTWIILCEGVSSLVPPHEIGDLQLVGRLLAGTHIAFVYSAHILLLVEPVLAYLQQSTWIAPDEESAIRFLLGTVRMALPEGLLGFFKSQGVLSRESVLGRLGLAAAVAYLTEEDPSQLLVSLDTDGARKWLGLREGSAERADLVALKATETGWSIQPIEVKARSDAEPWGTAGPASVREALGQVRVMEQLLRQIFELEVAEPFTPSRREILKRQVFLEALQQWEAMRLSTEGRYRDRLTELNRVFNLETEIEIAPRLFLVSSTQSAGVDEREVDDDAGSVPVIALGVPWLRRALQERPGSGVDIPIELLDELGLEVSEGDPANELAAVRSASIASLKSSEPTESTALVGSVQENTVETSGARLIGSMESIQTYADQLRDAFIARQVPFISISVEETIQGPSFIRVPFTVRPGSKLASVQGQESDLARDLGVQAVRITNWRGRPGYAVAELPRRNRVIPDVSSLVRTAGSVEYPELALGAREDFTPEWAALDKLPHLLVAGTTGSGKSVFLRSLLWQLTHMYGERDLDIVLIDAKGLADYLDFADAPQFRSATDFHSGVPGALELLTDIVENRLPARSQIFTDYARQALKRPVPVQVTNLRQLLADSRVSEISTDLRPLVVVVDEFAELLMASSDRKRFETLITRFVQVARAVGGHCIAATQRPSTDVVTGLMKSNFARVALRVQQSVDSRVILDENGAENLLGRGDLLFKSQDSGLIRLQGFSAIGPYAPGVR